MRVKEVEKIAALAKLQYDPDELDRFARHFQEILDYFSQLQELHAGEEIVPTFHALHEADLATPLRDDQVRPSLPPDMALAGAPAAVEQQFRVPKVIE